jgi:AraC family transcriptional regulator
MHYVRARRLTLAARSLATGAADILDLALESGYGSHEAFSRAFRAQFGATPESVRRSASTEELPMIEPMRNPDTDKIALEPPRFVEGASLLVVGLSERQSFQAPQGIPAQWQTFMAAYGDLPDKANPIPLGVSLNMDEDGTFDYVCGVEVTAFGSAPPGLVQLRLPAQRYAVFQHRGHVAQITATYSAIWNEWLPAQDLRAADAASLERHLESFDPRTGLGGVEIWIPIKAAG